jgi:hypothetical protein
MPDGAAIQDASPAAVVRDILTDRQDDLLALVRTVRARLTP